MGLYYLFCEEPYETNFELISRAQFMHRMSLY